MKTNRLKAVSFGSMILLMLVLIVATIVEKSYGTSFTVGNIYHTWWFIALWALLALSAMAYIMHVSRRKILTMLHISLTVVLAGAFVSFITSQRGEIALSCNGIPASMFTDTDGELKKLPFRMQLDRIDTDHTGAPAQSRNHTAHIIISNKENVTEQYSVSLNKPISTRGYTFCIKSVNNGNLSLLATYDPFGVPVSYLGYLMTLSSFAFLFFDNKSELNCILTKKRQRITYKSILIAIGIIILVFSRIKRFSGSDSQPILHTPLLTAHISTIITAYSLIVCVCLNSFIALFQNSDKKRLRDRALIGRLLLYPATMLLAAGIFIGAFWAHISWGRHWGWDPKEVWALITLLTCSITFHTRSLPLMAKPRIFHIYCIVIFLVMLFTYFGVNYLLGGLHSYT